MQGPRGTCVLGGHRDSWLAEPEMDIAGCGHGGLAEQLPAPGKGAQLRTSKDVSVAWYSFRF